MPCVMAHEETRSPVSPGPCRRVSGLTTFLVDRMLWMRGLRGFVINGVVSASTRGGIGWVGGTWD
jgi:hypothetical protein